MKQQKIIRARQILMSTRVATGAVVLVAFAFGIFVGSIMFGNRSEIIYKTRTNVYLTGPDGRYLGSLPIGTTFVSDLKLSPNSEFGWWAFLPVYFGTSREAYPQFVRGQKGSRRYAFDVSGSAEEPASARNTSK